MIHALMRTLGVLDAARVAKVGDTPADLLSGAAAVCGWNVGVTYGTHGRRELERHPHTHLIDDIRQLRGLLAL
jgi:phosphoglycolate phosphatase-like HAD superfamily hydrolase